MSKLTTQHKWLLAILGIVLVNASVWFFGLSPAMDKVEFARNEFTRVEQQKTKLEQRLGQLNAIDTDALQAEMEVLSLRVPELGMFREFLVEFESIAEELDIEIVNVSISAPMGSSPYLSIDFSISFIGTYSALFSNLETLEQHERLLLVHSFNLSGSDDTMTSSVQFTIFAEDFNQYTPHEAPGRNNPFKDS